MKIKIILIFLSVLGLSVIFTNCGKAPSASDGDTGPQTTPTPTLAENLNPWNASVAEIVNGVTYYDGWQDLRVLPAPVNISGGWTDSVHIASHGKSAYFTYSKQDAWTFMNSGGTQHLYNGPSRDPLMTVNDFRIFRADMTPTGWKVVYHGVNSNDANYPEASPSTNVAEDFMIFTRWSFTPPSDGNLYYSKKENGVWSAAQIIPGINTACEDDNGFVVGDLNTGIHIFFESMRLNDAGTSCGGKKHIYYSYFDPANGGSLTPVVKVAGLNGTDANDEDQQFYVSPDLSKAYWTAVRSNLFGIVTADRQPDGSYANMQLVMHPDYTLATPYAGRVVWVGEANVAEVPEGWLLYMMCGIAEGDLNGQPDRVRLNICRMKKPR